MKYALLTSSKETTGADLGTIVILEQSDGSIVKYGPNGGLDEEFSEWFKLNQKEFGKQPFEDYTSGYSMYEYELGNYSGAEKAKVDKEIEKLK